MLSSQIVGKSNNMQTGRIVLYDTFINSVLLRALEKVPKVTSKVTNRVLDILSALSFERDGVSYIEIDTATNFLRNFLLALDEGDSSFLFMLRGLKVSKIVDIDEFVRSREYLDLGITVRPRLMELLWDLFHNPENRHCFEVGLAGSIGWGKSFFSDVASAYILYLLSCYHSPQIEYKLAPGFPIVFTMQSVRLEQARRVLFNPFMDMIRRSPYFQNNFMFDPNITTEMRFPNNIIVMPLSSNDTAALGYNVFNAIMDELNFLSYVENSARVRGNEEIYDQASKLYMTTFRRIKSRCQIAGKSPGKLFLISSANYPGDFMDRKRLEAEAAERAGTRKTIYLVSMSRWEAFPPGTFSDDKFLVEVGDAVKKSRIISSVDDAIEPKDIIEVPIDFREEFEKDLEAAIRDIAGIPVGCSNSFIKQRENIVSAAKIHQDLFGGAQLFANERVDLSKYSDSLHSLVDLQYLAQDIDTSKPYVAHVDLALTGDSCGVSVCHFNGMQYVGKVFNWNASLHKYTEVTGGSFPSVTVDGVLEIVNAPGDEIDISLVGDLLLTVASHVNLVCVTADRFQSASLLQKLRKARNYTGKRIKTTLVSVDTTVDPYMELRQALRDGRIIIPPVGKLLKELRELQLDEKHGRVDHPKPGSKDLADAVCGAFYVIRQLYSRTKSRKFSGLYTSSSDTIERNSGTGERRIRKVRRLH